MENNIDNHVRIYAINEEVLNKAILVTKSQIVYSPRYGATNEVTFDKITRSYIYRMSFCTCWSPPIEAYENLNAIEGVTVDAIWFDEINQYDVCYYWPGEGHAYEPVERVWNDRGVEVWDFH